MPGLHYSFNSCIQTYTEPVPLKYGKLAVKIRSYTDIFTVYGAVQVACVDRPSSWRHSVVVQWVVSVPDGSHCDCLTVCASKVSLITPRPCCHCSNGSYCRTPPARPAGRPAGQAGVQSTHPAIVLLATPLSLSLSVCLAYRRFNTAGSAAWSSGWQ